MKELFAPDIVAGETSKRPPSITVQFKAQIKDLMTTLRKCSPHYVRCIKPNEEKKPGLVNPERVLHQVQYLNIKENVMVRRAGFCFRMPYRLFASRFKAICAKCWPHSGKAEYYCTHKQLYAGIQVDAHNPHPVLTVLRLQGRARRHHVYSHLRPGAALVWPSQQGQP